MSMDGHASALDGEEIARLAYPIWEERGRPIGSAEVDWYGAERQLQIRSGAIPPSSTGRQLRRRRRYERVPEARSRGSPHAERSVGGLGGCAASGRLEAYAPPIRAIRLDSRIGALNRWVQASSP